MSKIKLFSKVIPIFLITSILFTSCKIPDISKFTEASAEMTQAISTGVKETDSILEEASNSDLFEDDEDTLNSLKNDLKKYREAAEPTLKTLKALDGYLEALNSLAKAQQDSKKDSEAAVTAVSNLASAVAGINLPNTVISLGSGLVNLANTLRLEKDFKKRVILVERIVNGGSADNKKACTENTFEKTEKLTRAKLYTTNAATKGESDAIDKNLDAKLDEIDKKIKLINDEIDGINSQINQSNSQIEKEKLSSQVEEISVKIKKLEAEQKSAKE